MNDSPASNLTPFEVAAPMNYRDLVKSLKNQRTSDGCIGYLQPINCLQRNSKLSAFEVAHKMLCVDNFYLPPDADSFELELLVSVLYVLSETLHDPRTNFVGCKTRTLFVADENSSSTSSIEERRAWQATFNRLIDVCEETRLSYVKSLRQLLERGDAESSDAATEDCKLDVPELHNQLLENFRQLIYQVIAAWCVRVRAARACLANPPRDVPSEWHALVEELNVKVAEATDNASTWAVTRQVFKSFYETRLAFHEFNIGDVHVRDYLLREGRSDETVEEQLQVLNKHELLTAVSMGYFLTDVSIFIIYHVLIAPNTLTTRRTTSKSQTTGSDDQKETNGSSMFQQQILNRVTSQSEHDMQQERAECTLKSNQYTRLHEMVCLEFMDMAADAMSCH